MSEEEQAPQVFSPTAEHAFLASQAGTWTVHCSYSMGPDVAPMEVEATEQADMLGPFWLAARLEADMLGSPMHGHGSTGYDPVRKVYVATWKDSSNPFLYSFEGFHDQEENTLKLSGENYDPMRCVRSIYRSHIQYISDSEKRMNLSVEVDGGDVSHILEYHYRRA
ncbi:MAG: hypothetical protein ACI9NC_005916 [Verrucomicrobiales bacterium]|jgi:hypothetical protein